MCSCCLGAHPVDSNSCRAGDNSPTTAKCSALAPWLSLFWRLTSCELVPVQPDWKRPCCRRSMTSIVLRRTSRTGLPTFSVGPTLHTGRFNNMRGRRKKSFHLRSCLCSSPRSWPVDVSSRSHAQCCPVTAFQEEWNGLGTQVSCAMSQRSLPVVCPSFPLPAFKFCEWDASRL